MTVRRGLWLGVWSLILPSTVTALLVFVVWPETSGRLVAVTVGAGVLAGGIGGLGFRVQGWRLVVRPC